MSTFDTTTFNTNNSSIASAAATIAAAYAANKTALIAALHNVTGPAAVELAAQHLSGYAEDVARTLCAAGLTEVFAAPSVAQDARVGKVSDVVGQGSTGLQSVWNARVQAGHLGAHT